MPNATPDVAVGDLVEVTYSLRTHGANAKKARAPVVGIYGRRVAVQLPHWREEFDVSQCRVIERAKPAEQEDEMPKQRVPLDEDVLSEYARMHREGLPVAEIRRALDMTEGVLNRYRVEARDRGLIEPRKPGNQTGRSRGGAPRLVAAESWEPATADNAALAANDGAPGDATAPVGSEGPTEPTEGSETRQEVAAADDDSDQAMREREDMAAMERADANTAVTEPATPAEREVALADLHRSEDTTAARNAVPPQAEPTLDQRIRLQMIDVPLGAAFGRAETITIEMLAAMREAAYKRVMAADRALKAARALADVYETDELPADMMGPIWARFEAEVGA